MADDQKDRYIQYLAGENREHVLTEKAMQLVLEDFMAGHKALEDRMATFELQHQELKEQLCEERKLRKSAERKAKTLQEQLDYAGRNVLGTGVRESGKRQYPVILKSRKQTARMKKMTLTE